MAERRPKKAYVPINSAEQEPDTKKDEDPLPWEQPIDWLDPATWPLSLRFMPFAVILVGIFIAVYYQHFMKEPDFDITNLPACRATFHHKYFINSVRHQAESLSSTAREFGLAANAIEELLDPEKTVFYKEPFPKDTIPAQGLRMDQAVIWVYQQIRPDGALMFNDTVSGTDPAALGVYAIMAGTRYRDRLLAAERQRDFLLNDAQRHKNGAIAHNLHGTPEIHAADAFTVSPFLAYAAVKFNDTTLATAAYDQIRLSRDLLRIPKGSNQGLWQHSTASSASAWSSANALAVYGMLRTRATLAGWKHTREAFASEIASLDEWIAELIEAAMRADAADPKAELLHNVLGDKKSLAETSGTTLFAAAAYRAAMMQPAKAEVFIAWAASKRKAVVATIDEDGFAHPAANPRDAGAKEAVEQSAEGESFLLTMSAAWRDCVCERVCALDPEDQVMEAA